MRHRPAGKSHDGWGWAFGTSILPEVLEPVRRQRRINGGTGDRSMAKPACPGVAARAESPIVMTPVRHQAIQEAFLGRPDAIQAGRP
jgi:hypothetical protein